MVHLEKLAVENNRQSGSWGKLAHAKLFYNMIRC